MLNGFWRKLKSGSDIRGIAEKIDNSTNVQLTNEVIEKITFAFAKWLSINLKLDYKSISIAIGHDSRTSASRIKNVCTNTLTNMGINVYDCSLSSTPAMYMAVAELNCTASIQITASHLPSERNGFKFFTKLGGISKTDIEKILEIAQDCNVLKLEQKGNIYKANIMEPYCEKIKNLIKNGVKNAKNPNKPLQDLKIIVDAGNGAGGFFTDKILIPLGADTDGSVFLEPDGDFPNHIPNPENAEAIQSFIKTTKESEADLGIIFDTDVDRAAVAGKGGKMIEKSKLIALASIIALKNNPGASIVTDSVTSDYLREFIENRGGKQFRYKRGYQNVISMAKKLNKEGTNCPLAIETSGHAAFKENNFIDDGAYLAAKITIEMVNLTLQGKTLDEELKTLIEAKESVCLRMPIKAEDALEYSEKVLENIKNSAISNNDMALDLNNIEGIRINFPGKSQNGWALIRKSIHDPEIVMYIESYVEGGVKSVLNLIMPYLKTFDKLDASSANKLL